MRISEMLTAIAKWLENPNNEALLLAEYNEDCMKVAAETCLQAAQVLKLGAETIDVIEPPTESTISYDSIDTIAEIAAAFDESNNPELKKSASALDELLLTISAPPRWITQLKEAEDKKIDVLKQKYQDTYKELKDLNRIADAESAIAKSPFMKEYRSMEHALSTRSCPDHAGAQMARVGENMWQCDLDKKVYNYQAGYTDEKGNKVPGGEVSNQTDLNSVHPQSFFDSRETRLNDFK